MKNLSNKAREAVRSTSTKLAAGTTAIVASGSAFAQAGGGFDSASILADIATYSAMAIGLVGAFIAARWALKALGLLR